MESHLAASHNSRLVSSENSAENSASPVDFRAPRRQRFAMTEAMQAAISLVKSLGLVPTYRFLYVVELAITTESEFASISVGESAAQIGAAARLALKMGECVNYHWFEDSCWKHPKLSFSERDELRMREKARWY
jgi:hypothetical protein